MVTLVMSGLMVRQGIMAGSMWRSKVGRLMVARKQREKMGPRIRYSLQRPDSSDLLPLVRPHCLKFPPPSKIVPPSKARAFNTLACGGHFILKL
jgi:hypothetical protein